MFGYERVTAGAVAGLAFLGLFPGSAGALRHGHDAAERWCVKPGSNDIACRKEGGVLLPSAGGRTVRLSPESVVRTESGGLAQVAFKRQAMCEFGPLPTEIVTRYGGPSRLFLQRAGNAICTIGKNTAEEIPFFCDQNLQCPAIVTTSGPFSLRMETATASASSTSSTTTTSESSVTTVNNGEESGSVGAGEERSVVMVICSGSYEIHVVRPNSDALAAGNSSQRQLVRITLVETSTGVSLNVESIPSAGVCSGRTIRGQKDVLNL